MNKYREAMIHLRNLNIESAKICIRCAGWSSFGGLSTPIYISLYGDICICSAHWIKMEKIITKIKLPTKN